VTPFFCRHARIAAKGATLRAPFGGVAAALEFVEETPLVDAPEELRLAVALEGVPLDEPPQAVRPIQASNRIARGTAALVRLLVCVFGMELLCR
jgi:hypothetical protein